MLLSLALVVGTQVVLWRQGEGFSLSWGRGMRRTCSPEYMLCTHAEQCCAGVCVHHVYMYVIKVKQCTLLDHLKWLSPEEQLTYLRSEAVRDNLTRLGGRLRVVQSPEDIDPRHPLSLIRLVDETTAATTQEEDLLYKNSSNTFENHQRVTNFTM